MNSNEILPAIPRQKVKNKDTGEIGGVLCYHDGDIYPDFISVVLDNGNLTDWHADDCEPVPEEPRGFRVGEKVKCKNLFTTILEIATFDDGKNVYVLANGGQAEGNELRPATPQERKDYFLND